MNLHYLRVFLVVAEHEHITRASEELIISQPAVTKTIQNLEHEIGLELVERRGRHIELTHAGHVLRSFARRIFALEREMEEGIAALRDVEAGEVTLAANTTMGVYLLPPIIARFRARYPQVMLNISILNSYEIVEGILDWKLDFGIVESDPANLPEELKVEIFAHDELVLVVGADHRWRGVRSLSPEALGGGELVVREEGSGIREIIEQALLQLGVKITPLLTLPDNEAIKQMVMSGVGASFVSALTVQRELVSGDLIRIPVAGVELHPQMSFVMRNDKQLSHAAHAFCALLSPQMSG